MAISFALKLIHLTDDGHAGLEMVDVDQHLGAACSKDGGQVLMDPVTLFVGIADQDRHSLTPTIIIANSRQPSVFKPN